MRTGWITLSFVLLSTSGCSGSSTTDNGAKDVPGSLDMTVFYDHSDVGTDSGGPETVEPLDVVDTPGSDPWETTPIDPGTGDTPSSDVGDNGPPADLVEAGTSDVSEAEPDVPQSVLWAAIAAPEKDDVFEVGTQVTLDGTVGDSVFPADELKVTWSSSKDGILGIGAPLNDGSTSLTIDTLTAGIHAITLEVENPFGQKAWDTVVIGICAWASPETFDTDIAGTQWQKYGSAYWHPDGYLEMTGIAPDKKGAIYNLVDQVTPGDVSISFRILTGPDPGGADGFAMNVFEADDVTHLETLIEAAKDGGGLGYGVSGDYGNAVVSAFHVEFDTWHNVYNGTTQLHTDPTEMNHIGIMTNGDPGNHLLWAEIPSIEDGVWHDVTLEVTGDVVRVTLDGVEKINEAIPGMEFRGGFIGFSGTTGYYMNQHGFDDLQILQECLVPLD